MENLRNTKESANYLGISPRSLANSRSTGVGIVIPYIKIGGSVRYNLKDLDAYIEENTHIHTDNVK